ncbi:MAG: hypothetical protein M1831_004261 [Alyxoria varia]|nr:MAG: hypothetical protein M1831_004261 [Alyxoria varia]
MTTNAPTQYQAPRGERPHLLTFNRKLRHLQGISLRNLTTSPLLTRTRKKTIDDDALPYTLSSPRKLLALNESHEIAHFRSSSNLRAQSQKDRQRSPVKTERPAGNGTATPPATPQPKAPLRRNTLELAGASPKQRQQKVQDAIERHTADVFFSLHVEGFNEPVYISEVAEKAMNPDFRFFSLTPCTPAVTRNNSCTLKLWAHSEHRAQWIYVLEYTLNLENLQYIGKSIDNFQYKLPANTVFIHLTDGIYAWLPDIFPSHDPFVELPVPSSQEHSVKLPTNPTSSYDALMRLSTLDACIQDIISTRQTLISQINTLITANPATVPQEILPSAKDQLSSIKQAIAVTRSQIAHLQSHVASLRDAHTSRRTAIRTGREAHTLTRKTLTENTSQLAKTRSQHTETLSQVTGQRRRICNELQYIYPIDPLPNAKRAALSFAIRGLALPNSDFTGPDLREDAVSAALGHVAHMVQLLSVYLNVPLPYSVTSCASTSLIRDPISQMPGNRTFPLHLGGSGGTGAAPFLSSFFFGGGSGGGSSGTSTSTSTSNNKQSTATANKPPNPSAGGSPSSPTQPSTTTPINPGSGRLITTLLGSPTFTRFEYGVFLLNKDIELLANRVGLRLLDIRQTLPNLKYVVFVVTAGEGEVPRRKVSGFPRGLLMGRGDGGGVGSGTSTPGSVDSGDVPPSGAAVGAAEALRKGLRKV